MGRGRVMAARLCQTVAGLALAFGMAVGVPALAQTPAPEAAQARLPVLTLDFERLFDSTRWGKRLAADLAAESAALNAENNRIAEDLIAEEKALTDRRAAMSPQAFRTEADAFDERATDIRAAQKAKAQAFTQAYEASRQAFFAALAPLIDEVLAGRGAVVVLDRRAIIRGLEAADITDDLVALADERLGDGAALGAGATQTEATGQGGN